MATSVSDADACSYPIIKQCFRRVWANNEFNAWKWPTPAVGEQAACADELAFTALLIEQDCRNNSAWNHRFQCVQCTDTFKDALTLQREIECACSMLRTERKEHLMLLFRFTLAWIDKVPQNESSWSYLQGALDAGADAGPTQVPQVWQFCERRYEDQKQRNSLLLAFMLDALEQSANAHERCIQVRRMSKYAEYYLFCV